MVRLKTIGRGPSRSADTPYRGLQGPNGVVFKDADQKREFRKLEKRGMFLGKTFSWEILETLGLRESIESWVEVLKWTELVHIRRDGFRHLVYEFYSSLNVVMDYGDAYPQYTMFFRLKNHDHILTPEEFGRFLGCDWEGLFNPPNSWIPRTVWRKYGDGEYDPHTSKSTKLKNPALRVFHRFITYTLNARRQSNGQVTVRDLLLLDAACTGKRVDTATLLIRKMKEVRTERGEVALGSLVMFLAERLGVVTGSEDEPGRVKFDDSNLLNDQSLFRMGMIKRNNRGNWVMVEAVDRAEQEPHHDDGDEQTEAAPEISAAPAKRSRTEAGSSSSQQGEWQQHIIQQIDGLSTRVIEEFQRVHTRMDAMQAQLNRLESYHCFSISSPSPPPSTSSPPPPPPPPEI